jgi:hypothetical protein
MMMIIIIKRNGMLPRDKNDFWDETGLTLNVDNFWLKIVNELDCWIWMLQSPAGIRRVYLYSNKRQDSNANAGYLVQELK